MAAPFTDDEKRFILCEMIKESKLDVDVLVNVLKSREFEPDWFSMYLPHGRTINQCRQAAADMFGTTLEQPTLKRKSLGDHHDDYATKRPAGPRSAEHVASQSSPSTPSIPAAAVPVSQPRTLTSVSAPARTGSFHQQPLSISQHVDLRPQPPAQGTYILSAPPQPQPGSVPPAPTGRRRGRPSRANKSGQLRRLAPLAPRIDPPITGATRPLMPLGRPPGGTPGFQTTADRTYNSTPASPGTPGPRGVETTDHRARPPLAGKSRTRNIDGISEPLPPISPGPKPDQIRHPPTHPPVSSRSDHADPAPSTAAPSPSPPKDIPIHQSSHSKGS